MKMFQKVFKSLVRKHHTILNDRLLSSMVITPVKAKNNMIGYVIQDRANMKQFGIDCHDHSLFMQNINEENGEFMHLFSTSELSSKEESTKFINNHSGSENVTYPLKYGDHVDIGGLSIYMMKGLTDNGEDKVMYCVFGDNQPRLFTGDIIQSCGVGIINENQYNTLFDLIYNHIFTLPPQTLIYPGKDEILRNIFFASSIEPENPMIKTLKDTVYFHVSEGKNCPPLSIYEEQQVNPFFRLKDENLQQIIRYTNPIDVMKELFDRRNKFNIEKAVDEYKYLINKENENFVKK